MDSRKRTHAQVEQPSLKERARNACASGEGTTTSELRDIARQLGIRNVSAMSKTKLCEAIHINISPDEPVYPVTLDESDIPDGLQDPISLELMQDPIIASDGYTYDRVSLRNLFVAEQRRFVTAGRPRNRPVTVRSLFDRDVVLSNPFGDIGGLPASFPLIENKSLARTIAEWRIQHGFDVPDSSEVGASAAAHAEPLESQRDHAGFHNGIFVGNISEEEDEEDEEDHRVEIIELGRVQEREFRSQEDFDAYMRQIERDEFEQEMREIERDGRDLEPEEDIEFRQLWDTYHQSQSRQAFVSMWIYVARYHELTGPLKMEYGVIDMIKPKQGENDDQALKDWRRYIADEIFDWVGIDGLAHRTLTRALVEECLSLLDEVKRGRLAAPEQFELFLTNRSNSILRDLLKTVSEYSPSVWAKHIRYTNSALEIVAPRNGQSWAQWKTLVLRLVRKLVLTRPGWTMRHGSVVADAVHARWVFPPL